MTNKNQPVFFVIHGLPVGGAEFFLINLVNHFHKNGGHAILILLGGSKKLAEHVNKNIETVFFSKYFKFDFIMLKNFRYLIVSRKPSILFCINGYSLFISKLASLGLGNIHFILSPHTTKAFSLKNHLLTKLFLSTINKNDKIIFLCKYQMRYLQHKYLSNNINGTVIYNGVDTEHFKPSDYHLKDAKSIREKHGINNEDSLILIVGRISLEKRQEDAISALAILHDIYQIQAHLLFVGAGNENLLKKLKLKSQEYSLEHYIHFAGNKHEVRPYYMACNLFSLTSGSETFSLAALEAMSIGKPCVLTDVGGAKEMIEISKNGLLAKPYNAHSIASAWKHILTRQKYSPKTIRENIEQKFNSNLMLENYMHELALSNE